MKTTFWATAILAVLFGGIVLLEQVPGVMTPTADPHESLFFGLFEISLLDDITHGLSGLLALLALFLGYHARVGYLALVGGYYALDATFYLLYGFAAGQPLMDNVLLNGPHVAITILVGYALWSSVERVVLKDAESDVTHRNA